MVYSNVDAAQVGFALSYLGICFLFVAFWVPLITHSNIVLPALPTYAPMWCCQGCPPLRCVLCGAA